MSKQIHGTLKKYQRDHRRNYKVYQESQKQKNTGNGLTRSHKGYWVVWYGVDEGEWVKKGLIIIPNRFRKDIPTKVYWW